MEQGTFDFPDEPAAPVKLCECGCGKPAPITKETNRRLGYIKGQPMRYAVGHTAGGNRAGRKSRVFVETGQRFGKGVVIDPEVRKATSGTVNGRRAVRLHCDCGNEYVADLHAVVSGRTKSCGCLLHEMAAFNGRKGKGRPVVDRMGQRFGKLLVIGFVDTAGGYARWLCKCDCDNEIIVASGNLRRAVGCGCEQGVPRIPRGPGETARLRILQQYQRGARNRGFVWELTDEDFDSLTSSNCHYCGQPPSTVFRAGKYEGGTFTYNGLDRRDPAQGYVRQNVLPCCPFCNRAKSDMSYEDFMVWTLRLVMNQWDHPERTPSHLPRGGEG